MRGCWRATRFRRSFLSIKWIWRRDGNREILRDLKESLGGNFVDFGADGTESFYEEAAVSGEAELEEFLETGQVSKDAIRSRIASRDLFPCYFGSALKNTGVEEFMRGLEEYTLEPVYPDEFGAKIFKIVRDNQGERLTYMQDHGRCAACQRPDRRGKGKSAPPVFRR